MLANVLRKLILVVFTVLILPLLYLLEPFVRIRLALMYNQRIGHLSGNTDVFMRKMRLYGKAPRTFYFFFVYDPANNQLVKMLARHITIVQNHTAVRIYYAIYSVLVKTRFFVNLRQVDDPEAYAVTNKVPSTMAFTEEEECQGRALLAEMGIGENDWFVCIYGRDLAYLYNWRPHEGQFWPRTAFRNISIQNYLQAAEYITGLGGFVIRVGSHSYEALPDLGNPRIIDYTTKHRSDFGDIYLSAKCRFFLGCASGLTGVPTMFDRPVAFANASPLFVTPPHSYDQFVPPLLRRVVDGSLVPYWEAFEAGLFDYYLKVKFDEACAQHDWEIEVSQPEDIELLAMDMADAAAGVAPSAEARALQLYYQDVYQRVDGKLNNGGLISPRFAMKYRQLILRPGDTVDVAEMAAARA